MRRDFPPDKIRPFSYKYCLIHSSAWPSPGELSITHKWGGEMVRVFGNCGYLAIFYPLTLTLSPKGERGLKEGYQ
jgi:hypothetical protein